MNESPLLMLPMLVKVQPELFPPRVVLVRPELAVVGVVAVAQIPPAWGLKVQETVVPPPLEQVEVAVFQ